LDDESIVQLREDQIVSAEAPVKINVKEPTPESLDELKRKIKELEVSDPERAKQLYHQYESKTSKLNLSAYDKGNRVKVVRDTGDLVGVGTVVDTGKDISVKFDDGNSGSYSADSVQPLNEIGGRPISPPQYHRIGDPLGLMDSPSDVGAPTSIREWPNEYAQPRGDEGQSLINPPDLFYTNPDIYLWNLQQKIQEKYSEQVSKDVLNYVKGKETALTSEVIAALDSFGLCRFS